MRGNGRLHFLFGHGREELGSEPFPALPRALYREGRASRWRNGLTDDIEIQPVPPPGRRRCPVSAVFRLRRPVGVTVTAAAAVRSAATKHTCLTFTIQCQITKPRPQAGIELRLRTWSRGWGRDRGRGRDRVRLCASGRRTRAGVSGSHAQLPRPVQPSRHGRAGEPEQRPSGRDHGQGEDAERCTLPVGLASGMGQSVVRRR